jgi:hypothetical protein
MTIQLSQSMEALADATVHGTVAFFDCSSYSSEEIRSLLTAARAHGERACLGKSFILHALDGGRPEPGGRRPEARGILNTFELRGVFKNASLKANGLS